MATKFVKGYCDKAKQYFALEMKQVGSQWKVANMTHLDSHAAKVVSTELDPGTFVTDDSLVACRHCGNRRVGGCDHSKSNHPCSVGMKYQFDCIYCKDFQIDYSLPTAADVGGRTGETVQLSQGQEVKIRFADRPLTQIFVGVGWDPADSSSDANMDVDSSVVVASGSTATDLVYFASKTYGDGCIVHHGDNLYGDAEGDDENISVRLDKVPSNRDKVIFVLNIYNADERGQSLASVKNLYIRLCDPESKKVLIEYRVDQASMRDNAIVIGMAVRRGSDWAFKAIGKSLNTSSVGVLKDECMRYAN